MESVPCKVLGQSQCQIDAIHLISYSKNLLHNQAKRTATEPAMKLNPYQTGYSTNCLCVCTLKHSYPHSYVKEYRSTHKTGSGLLYTLMT